MMVMGVQQLGTLKKRLFKQTYNNEKKIWEDSEELSDQEKSEYEFIENNLNEDQNVSFAQACSDMFLMQMAMQEFPKKAPDILQRTNIARS
tara:strand:- start:1946 stop:2218 length:273 start_codon:yes stop_codon:yes gene_type:complete